MGMRIHTEIGFGLNIAGMNPKVLKSMWNDKDAFKRRGQAIVEKMQKNGASPEMRTESMWFSDTYLEKYPFNLHDMITYNDEFLGEDYLLLKPHPFGKSAKWNRYDDDIDYFHAHAFEQELGEPTEIVWRQAQRTIYPYYGLMRKNYASPLGIEHYTTPLYMDDPELKDTVIPFAPRQLLFYIEALELVERHALLDTFFKLRPTYAKWWA